MDASADGELLSIGTMARSSGLSVKALRNYDRLGLLRPAAVHPYTGYRRYTDAQLPRARAIKVLRSLDVPLEVIREVLEETDDERVGRLLAEHRARVEARLWRAQRILHRIQPLLDHGKESLMATTGTAPIAEDVAERLARETFNAVWELLEKTDRTTEEDDRMLHGAHASRYLWELAGGGAERLARGEWQCSRVYAVLGRGEPALHHARRCLEICQEHGFGDFDLAFAYEALARASAVAGDAEGAANYANLARKAGEDIKGQVDRDLFAADMASLPVR